MRASVVYTVPRGGGSRSRLAYKALLSRRFSRLLRKPGNEKGGRNGSEEGIGLNVTTHCNTILCERGEPAVGLRTLTEKSHVILPRPKLAHASFEADGDWST
jgi:hypothetical protein